MFAEVSRTWEHLKPGPELDVEVAKRLGYRVEAHELIHDKDGRLLPPSEHMTVYWISDAKGVPVNPLSAEDGRYQLPICLAEQEAWTQAKLPQWTTDIEAALALPLPRLPRSRLTLVDLHAEMLILAHGNETRRKQAGEKTLPYHVVRSWLLWKDAGGQ